ncbi:hypothetical protein [Sporosarcina sp. FSL K6-3457]|uniref:hypothetical protein n=1 Tax=Sporosarcina sp. FSL K6-3457 TaxID=2978204 RepID=UPI0030F8EB61
MKSQSMGITVNEQPQYFNLAFETEGKPNWQQKVGHEIRVGPYRFCAIPLKGCINVSEVTTGLKIDEISLNPLFMAMTATQEDALVFFRYVIGPGLKGKIESSKNFDELLVRMQEKTFERLGEMPRVSDVAKDLQDELTRKEI